jgi:DNA replication protein DnaC
MIRDGIITSAGYAYYDADVWKGWRGATIAVLDELGIREKASDFQYETVKKAIDERIDNERPLILISNMSIPELARCYDDRIASRVGSGTVLVMNGDRRLSAG